MFSEKQKAHAALLGANLFYGAGFTVAKSVMPALIKPGAFILIRVSCAAFLFWLSYVFGKNFRTAIHASDRLRLIACGILGVATNQLFFFKGLSLTSPIHGSLMMLSTPILVSIFAAIWLHEKLSAYNVLGLILGVTGAIWLIMQAQQTHYATNPMLGDFFIFLNAASYAAYLILVKPLMQRYRPIIVIRWVFLIGWMAVLPFGWSDFMLIEWQQFTLQQIAAVGFIVIGVTFFTYLWNIYALRILSPAVAGAYIYLQPLFAAIIAIVFLHEPLGWIKSIAGLLIFAGVFLAGQKKK